MSSFQEVGIHTALHPSLCHQACWIDNGRALRPTGFKLGMEVGHDQRSHIIRLKENVMVTLNTKSLTAW